MDRMRISRGSLWLGVAACLALVGCGDGRPKLVPVSGVVKIDGKPLQVGQIRLICEQGRPATGTLDSEGRFKLGTFDPGDGCILGKHGVEVFSLDTSNPAQPKYLVPEKYNNAATSQLTANIEKATDNLEFNLTWAGSTPKAAQDLTGDLDPTKQR